MQNAPFCRVCSPVSRHGAWIPCSRRCPCCAGEEISPPTPQLKTKSPLPDVEFTISKYTNSTFHSVSFEETGLFQSRILSLTAKMLKYAIWTLGSRWQGKQVIPAPS